MGFKVDSSFLKFVTMGALGSRAVTAELQERGFFPIELERYSQSNKIWATKVKRLRLPDLLCVRTGLRVEVRAKSALAIKMSDAPDNPDRAWDAGLRNDDVIALVACSNEKSGPVPAKKAVYLPVEALRQSVGSSRLGPPKSASEGAERDREWPSTVPKRPGKVLSADAHRIITLLGGDGAPDRRQTFTLNGRTPYVQAGDTFVGSASMVAGTPARLADLNAYLGIKYNPLSDLQSTNSLDRYAAVKAIRFREDLHREGLPLVESLIGKEEEVRVALEGAGTAAALGSAAGEDLIRFILWDLGVPEMSMEAIFILTELRTDFARDALLRVAHNRDFAGDERRQAAIWGLGKAGHQAYADLLPFIADAEENVALHAVAAFGSDAPRTVIEELVSLLVGGDDRLAPAASEVMRQIGGRDVLGALVDAVKAQTGNTVWALTTLGRLDPDLVRSELRGTPLLEQVEPLLLIAPGANWLANEDTASSLTFLHKQNLG